MANTSDVSVRGLSKHFGPVRAVQELSFEVPAGQVTGFLGPNGAGKTTTLRIMLGLVRPSAGQALTCIKGVRQRGVSSTDQGGLGVVHFPPRPRSVLWTACGWSGQGAARGAVAQRRRRRP